jgi:hypothetical protein
MAGWYLTALSGEGLPRAVGSAAVSLFNRMSMTK